MGPSPTRLFFIFGRGRSGTSLLREILNAHSQVAVAPESMFALSTFRKYRRAHWTKQRILAFVEDVFLESRMQNWGVTPGELCEALLRVPPAQMHFGRMVEEVYRCYASQVCCVSECLYGDKNPTYSLFADRLQSVLLNSTAIVLVRDPLDNVASFRRVPFDASDVATLAWRWRMYNDALLRFVDQTPAKALLIRYEDLVREPSRTLSRITEHLGVSFEHNMLRFYENVDRPLESWHENLCRPLNTSRIGRGRRDLSAQEQQLVSYITAPVATRLDYVENEPRADPRLALLSLAGRLRAAAWDLAERSIFHLPSRPRAILMDMYRRSTGSLPRTCVRSFRHDRSGGIV